MVVVVKTSGVVCEQPEVRDFTISYGTSSLTTRFIIDVDHVPLEKRSST